MILATPKGSLLQIIGDPHMGKKFVNGVPLHRRGEREAMQLARLQTLLAPADRLIKTVVCVGDLFDTFVVTEEVKFTVFHALASAAWAFPEITYIIMRGNHDVSRDTDERSSFEVLESMCGSIPNIIFVNEPEFVRTRDTQEWLAFFPYDAFIPAAELVSSALAIVKEPIAIAFGHWDVEDFGNPHNLVPIKELLPFTKLIVTGHVHKAQEIALENDSKLIITGSMLPYSHGEDLTGWLYATVTLLEYELLVAKHPDFFHNKSLRILLGKDEKPPTGVDAFQLTFSRRDEEVGAVEVRMEVFSFKDLFNECFVGNNVTKELTDEYWTRYEGIASDAAKS